MKLKLFDRDHSAVGYDFEVINPEVLLNQPAECSAIEDFSFKAFCQGNKHIKSAFEASSDQAEFAALFKAQVKDGLQTIISANQAKPDSGFVIVARATSIENKPIVGFLMGVRNGIQLPSQSYNDKVHGSKCGLGEGIWSAFGPVIMAFDFEKMSKHQNLFMLGLTAVDQQHFKKGIATGMLNCLSAILAKTGYDGAFSIATSAGAYALRDHMQNRKVFLETNSICFAGVSFEDANKLEAFIDIDLNCRTTPSAGMTNQ